MEQNPHPEPLPAIHHRYRATGWTPDVQRDFIHALAACGSVVEACRVVNRSASSAYRLRARPAAQAFRNAWNAAQATAYRQVLELAMDRAVLGIEQPVYHKGEQVGFKTTHSDRLLCYLLGHLRPEGAVPKTAPDPEQQDFAIAEALAGIAIERIEQGETLTEEEEADVDEEQETLQEWRETIEGRCWPPSGYVTPRADDAPDADTQADDAGTPARDPSYGTFPTAADLRAMTPEERDAFDADEEKAFQETVRLGRSVGIEPGTRNADSRARVPH